MGSNQRRLSRRFYSPILLSEAYAANLPLYAPRQNFGPPPSAMRPCAGSRWRGDARTGTDGGVRRLRLHAPIRAFVAADLRRSRCHFTFSVFPAAGFGLGVLGDEGVGDALVGDAVPRAAGDLGRGQDHGECQLHKARQRTATRRTRPRSPASTTGPKPLPTATTRRMTTTTIMTTRSSVRPLP
jgi:hypothetical protein